MSDIKNDVFYYDKQGVKHNTTCDKLRIPQDLFHYIIDNLYATLNFVAETSTYYHSSKDNLTEACNRAIQPYSEAVRKYGYEFFIQNIEVKHEITNISCVLREI